MAVEIKINPLDFEKNVAIGIDLPMMAGAGANFQLNYMSLDQAVANAKNLLLTNKGERIMQPEFGVSLDKTLFENINEDLTITLENIIKSNFNYWLPYIFINELLITPSEDQNRIYVKMTISLQGNTIDTRSIQLEVSTT